MLRVKTKTRSGILWGLGATLTAAAIFGVVIYKSPAQTSHAASETVVTTGATSGRVNQQIPITGISIGGTGNDNVPVNLSVTNGMLYVTTTNGITFSGATSGSTISFSGARNDVNAALATLHYSSTTVGSDSLTVSLSGQNTIFNPANGHIYQYVPTQGDWFAARDAAAASTYQGLTGYLATITSDDENQFIKDRLSGDAWLGGSDDGQYGGEGVWEWVTGPEAGTNIFNGQGPSGVTVPGQYTNWAGGEPNNSAPEENCMETYISSGSWNDLPCDDADLQGYVVEYGDSGSTSTGIPNASVAITTTAATFAGGDGTSQDPYQVTDCERLQDLNQDLSANYIVTHDIDCTDTPNWNGGQGFVPIGDDRTGSPFTGTFDGLGYAIDGLTEIRADDDSNTDDNNDYANNQDYVGLFGYANGSTISNVNLTHIKIKGYMYVGGLVGMMINGTISSASVNQDLDESTDTSCTPGYCVWARYGQYGGGLVGWMVAGQIYDGQVGGLVKGSGNYIGGLVGHMEGGAYVGTSTSTAAIDGGYAIGGAVGDMFDSSILYRVAATGNVVAKIDDEVGKPGWYAGGLVGYGSNITISQSSATGAVHADAYYAGGIAGYISSSTISDVYATGNISAENDPVGGLIGSASFNTISRTYASGHVTSADNTGALIGTSFQDVVNDSFATGEVTGSGTVGALAANWGGASAGQFYYDATATRIDATHCDTNGTIPGCTPINANGSQPDSFINYGNVPFKQNNTQVWDVNNVWFFDGANLPVLRRGVNSSQSSLPPIDDHDGISTAVEDAAPNNGDGNNDGIADSTQANVVSFVNPVTNKYVTLEVNTACSITAATSAAAIMTDDSYLYPFGLVNYTVDCGTPGFSTTVKIYYHNLASMTGLIVRKYNTATNMYATISSATITGANPVEVSYSIADGSALDEDGTQNGIIVDPVGLATQNATFIGAPNTGLKSESVSVIIFSAIGGVVLISVAIITVRRTLKKDGHI